MLQVNQLPTQGELVAAQRGVPRTEAFASALFGDSDFAVWPSMKAEMTPVREITGSPDWERLLVYSRVAFGRFLTVEDELAGRWKEFRTQAPDGSVTRSIWTNHKTGRLAMVEGAKGGSTATTESPLGSENGQFLNVWSGVRTFQVFQFYDEPDLGGFFDTCVPLQKGAAEYLVCRDLTAAPRALQKIRYELWQKILPNP
jgi:hypothetical protein